MTLEPIGEKECIKVYAPGEVGNRVQGEGDNRNGKKPERWLLEGWLNKAIKARVDEALAKWRAWEFVS